MTAEILRPAIPEASDKKNKPSFPVKTPEGVSGQITEKSGRKIEYGEGRAKVSERRGYKELMRDFSEEGGVIYVEDHVRNVGDEEWVSTGKRIYDRDVDEIVTIATSIKDQELRPQGDELKNLPPELAKIYKIQERYEGYERLEDQRSDLEREIDARRGGNEMYENTFFKAFYDVKDSVSESKEKQKNLKDELKEALKIYNSTASKEIREKSKETINMLRRKLGEIEEEIRVNEEKIREAQRKIAEISEELEKLGNYEFINIRSEDEQVDQIQAYLQRITKERASKSLTKDSYEIIEQELIALEPSLSKNKVESFVKDLVIRRVNNNIMQNFQGSSQIDKYNPLLSRVLQNPNKPTLLKGLPLERIREYIFVIESILKNPKLCEILGGSTEIKRILKEIKNENGIE